MTASIARLMDEVVACRRCPRLVAYREQIARQRRRQFRDDTYWGRPVPSFGDPDARLVILGLAPAAHGANRTGRMFTGDRSGEWLYRALHAAAFANQAESHHRDDGLVLTDAYITATVRCAPPDNRPSPSEMEACSHFLDRELDLLPSTRVVLALGKIAFDAYLAARRRRERPIPKPRPRFRHGLEIDLGDVILLASYHPSQQNTFTGRLTREAFQGVFGRARDLLDQSGPPRPKRSGSKEKRHR